MEKPPTKFIKILIEVIDLIVDDLATSEDMSLFAKQNVILNSTL